MENSIKTAEAGKAGIVSYGSYIPRYRIKTEEIAKFQGQNPVAVKKGLVLEEKSVPGIDEDTITISVEAARNCLRKTSITAQDIGAIYIGSESHPYAVKPTGTVVAEAIRATPNLTVADFEFACKAGTAAIQCGLAMVKSGMAKYALCGGSDTAQAAPGDPLEYTASAGGAMFLIGKDAANKEVVAEIKHTCSYTTDTPDFWRRENQEYPSHGGPFTGEPAYFKHIVNATKLLFEQTGTKASDFDFAVFHQPNGKFYMKVAKMLGFSKEQCQDGLLCPKIGNTYSAASLLGLCNILNNAKAGQKILVTSYGSGAGSDSFFIEVSDEIEALREKSRKENVPDVKYYLENKKHITYAEMIKLRRELHG